MMWTVSFSAYSNNLKPMSTLKPTKLGLLKKSSG